MLEELATRVEMKWKLTTIDHCKAFQNQDNDLKLYRIVSHKRPNYYKKETIQTRK